MEYFDILDENGNPTGQKKLRNQVHKDGDWHKSVHVWIMNEKGELLLQKRSPTKESHPNKWDISFAGHIEAGATSIETVIKEGAEELGIKISEKDIQFLFTYKKSSVLNNGTFINNEFNDVYLLRKELDISKIKLQKEEVSEVKWYSIDELKKALVDRKDEFVSHNEEYEELFSGNIINRYRNNFGIPTVDNSPMGIIGMEGNMYRGMTDIKSNRSLFTRIIALLVSAIILVVPGLGYLYLSFSSIINGNAMFDGGIATLIIPIAIGVICTGAGFMGIRANIK